MTDLEIVPVQQIRGFDIVKNDSIELTMVKP